MKKRLLFTLTILAILVNIVCPKDTLQAQPATKQALNQLYQAAITDAMVADSSEICNTLCAIKTGNPQLTWKTIRNQQYILVGSFNKNPASYADTTVVNTWGLLWVFIPSQYKNRMRSAQIQNRDTLLRMRQLLGLPPTNTSNYIVELWAKPADLFRPAADPEPDDATAGLYLPVTADTTYSRWFEQNIYDSYFSNGTHYPWTRLGYTYDWAKQPSEIGVSEYCVRKNSVMYVEKLYPAAKYIAKNP